MRVIATPRSADQLLHHSDLPVSNLSFGIDIEIEYGKSGSNTGKTRRSGIIHS